jgi:hypothetical protein
MENKEFIEVHPGLWYEEATGLPWSSREHLKGVGCGRGYSTDGELFRLYRPRLWHCVVWEHFNGKKPKGKFRARITLDYKEIHLGYFDDPKVAYEAYLAAKVKHHGIESIAPLR